MYGEKAFILNSKFQIPNSKHLLVGKLLRLVSSRALRQAQGKLSRGISLKSRPLSKIPRLRFAPLGMTARSFILLFTFFSVLFAFAQPSLAWDPAWKYQMKLSFRNGARTENLVNFPILVHLTSKNFDFTQAKTNGEDIRFLDSDDSTVLSYEIESWNQGGKEAWIWVKVPQIDKTSDGDFIICIGGMPGLVTHRTKTMCGIVIL